MHHRQTRRPQPSVTEPRPVLLRAVRLFVQAASGCPGVRRISLVGSLTTDKPIPKDADVLVIIDGATHLDELARAGRQLKGAAQKINLGADIFLADEGHRYLGRICGFRECHPRVWCRAQNCGARPHLNDDLHVVTLPEELITAPPVDLWPTTVRRAAMPPDVEQLLLRAMEQVRSRD